MACWGIPQAIKEIESSVMALLEREGLGTFTDKKAMASHGEWLGDPKKLINMDDDQWEKPRVWVEFWETTGWYWLPGADSLKFRKAQHMSKHQTAPKSPKACNPGGPYGPYGGGPWYDISGCTPQDCIAAAHQHIHQPGFDRSNRESPWVGVEYRVSVLADLWYICGERYRKKRTGTQLAARGAVDLGFRFPSLFWSSFLRKTWFWYSSRPCALHLVSSPNKLSVLESSLEIPNLQLPRCELPKGFVDAADKQINSSMEGSTSLFSKLLWDVCPNMSARSHSRRKHLLSQVLLPRIWKFRTFPVLACRPPDRHSR